MKTKRRKLKNS